MAICDEYKAYRKRGPGGLATPHRVIMMARIPIPAWPTCMRMAGLGMVWESRLTSMPMTPQHAPHARAARGSPSHTTSPSTRMRMHSNAAAAAADTQLWPWPYYICLHSWDLTHLLPRDGIGKILAI